MPALPILQVAVRRKRMKPSFRTVKRVAVCAILFAMPIRPTLLSHAVHPFTSYSLADQPRVRAALDWFGKNLGWINDEQVKLTEIPAPSFQEAKRAAAVRTLFAAEGFPVHGDKIGNVIAEVRGT